MFLNCIAVGAGGFLGAVSRYLMGMIPFLQKGSLPYHTLLINVLGAVLIGIVVKTADSTEILNPSTVLFLKVGICGGFTTFSTFSLESLDLLQSGRPAAFAVYAIASVVLCVAGVLGGKWIAGILQAYKESRKGKLYEAGNICIYAVKDPKKSCFIWLCSLVGSDPDEDLLYHLPAVSAVFNGK